MGMSTRTQEEGRSYYTERDVDFTPSTFAEGDIFRTNNEWMARVLWATRRGDVTYDRGTMPFAAFSATLRPSTIIEGRTLSVSASGIIEALQGILLPQ